MISGFIAAILGIVEGLTEFLPISSTAHLILASEALRLEQTETLKTFEIAVQGGAILAVLALYWRRFLDIEVMKRVVAAFLPTALIGFLLYKLIKVYLIGNVAVVLWSLAIGGALIIVFEYWYKNREMARTPEAPMPTDDIRTLSYGRSALIGLAQAVAVVPGVSRSAATIIGGLWLGISRKAIAEFSFLLAVPTILAAAGYDILKNPDVFSGSDLTPFLIGFTAAFVTAVLAIKLFISYLQKHSFVAFGIYRIAVAAVFALLLSTGY